MKRIVNASNHFVLLTIKPKENFENEAFQGCDSRLKSDLFEVFNTYDEMFQEPKGLPPKSGIQYEIQLQQVCALPNIGLYKMLVIENEKIKRQIQEFLDKGVVIPSTSTAHSTVHGPILMVSQLGPMHATEFVPLKLSSTPVFVWLTLPVAELALHHKRASPFLSAEGNGSNSLIIFKGGGRVTRQLQSPTSHIF